MSGYIPCGGMGVKGGGGLLLMELTHALTVCTKCCTSMYICIEVITFVITNKFSFRT
jgi:hypothetical protein